MIWYYIVYFCIQERKRWYQLGTKQPKIKGVDNNDKGNKSKKNPNNNSSSADPNANTNTDDNNSGNDDDDDDDDNDSDTEQVTNNNATNNNKKDEMEDPFENGDFFGYIDDFGQVGTLVR